MPRKLSQTFSLFVISCLKQNRSNVLVSESNIRLVSFSADVSKKTRSRLQRIGTRESTGLEIFLFHYTSIHSRHFFRMLANGKTQKSQQYSIFGEAQSTHSSNLQVFLILLYLKCIRVLISVNKTTWARHHLPCRSCSASWRAWPTRPSTNRRSFTTRLHHDQARRTTATASR